MNEIIKRIIGNYSRKTLIIILIVGIILMIGPGILKINNNTAKSEEKLNTFDENKIKKELEDILSKINGAGKVEVMIVFENKYEKIVAKDIKSSSNEQNDKNVRDIDSMTVMSKEGNVQTPFVVKEMIPTVRGVIVVADGAKNSTVKGNIKNAVKTVLNVEYIKLKFCQESEECICLHLKKEK